MQLKYFFLVFPSCILVAIEILKCFFSPVDTNVAGQQHQGGAHPRPDGHAPGRLWRGWRRRPGPATAGEVQTGIWTARENRLALVISFDPARVLLSIQTWQ